MPLLTPDLSDQRWMTSVAGFLAIVVASVEAFITIGPYFGLTPTASDPTLAAQQQAVMQNVFIGIVSFFFGASVGNRKKDEAIASLAASNPTQPEKTQ